MPKLKSKSAAKKRFSTTASGKLKRNYAFKSHNLSKRSKSMKRKTRGSEVMHPTNAKHVRPMLPYAR